MRKSAEERREEILGIGMEHFAAGGFHGTSTEAIARDAGISQPYLFRLFRTKRELFLACTDRACAMIIDTFTEAASDAAPGEELHAMGHAYVHELLPDRHALLTLMQGYAATADPEIRAHVREQYENVVTQVTQLSGATPQETWDFFSMGMLLNIYAALDLEQSEHPVIKAWAALHD